MLEGEEPKEGEVDLERGGVLTSLQTMSSFFDVFRTNMFNKANRIHS